MPVYLPTAAVGNGRVLATLGGAGEIMTFFYPRIDFAQNIHECLPALYVGDPGHGIFLWTFGPQFQRSQEYVSETNIVCTELMLDTPPLVITFHDFCPPQTSALVRIIQVENRGDGDFRGVFLHYFDLNLGEIAAKQAVRFLPDEGYVLQYFRDVVMAVGGTRPDIWRCGKSTDPDSPASAKSDLYDGHLNGQPEDIGQVNFALGYRLKLAPGEQAKIEIILSAQENPHRSATQFASLRDIGAAELLTRTVQDNRSWLQRRRTVRVSEPLEEAYQRALLSLSLLADAHQHSFIAAPEFDPAYQRCGGYGYCWPRDASAAALAFHKAGYEEYLQGLVDWYCRVQLPSGLWAQRYWADGQVAASWSLREDFHQIDQSAAALLAICRHVLSRPEDAQQPALQATWPTINKAATALADMVDERGLHKIACDLWETYCGVFLYSNAAVHAALREAAACAHIGGEGKAAARWRDLAASTRQATIDLYNGEYFPRGLHQSGHVDHTVDSSTLGLCEPFALLSVNEPDERQMIESNLTTIQQRLSISSDGGMSIRRYEGDGYLGGVIGAVNTLWAALVSLRLAEAYQDEDTEKSNRYRQQAVEYIEFTLAHTTPTGLLPELIGLQPDIPYWAAPHSWASGLLVECVLALDGLGPDH